MEWRKEESSPLSNITTITVGPPSKRFGLQATRRGVMAGKQG